MDTLQTMMSRRSYRGAYTKDPVKREDLERIVRAGLAAPSGCNLQTTTLVGVDDPALMAKLNALLNKSGERAAPAAVCVLTTPEICAAGVSFHVQDYSAAIQNVLLAAHALGYASCWIEGDARGSVGEDMLRALNLSGEFQLAAILPLGVPAREVKAPTFKPFEQRAWFNLDRHA